MPHSTTLIVILAAICGFLVAAGGGFALGYSFAASAPNRLLRRAGRNTTRCLTEARKATDIATRFCEAVAAATTATEQQFALIAECQRRLSEAVGKLRPLSQPSAVSEPVKIEWIMEPLDRETELPNADALQANLARLLAAAKDKPRGGILLVSLDGLDRIRQRIDRKDLASLRSSAARVLRRLLRDEDLACSLDESTFVLLMPDRDTPNALTQAVAVREAFRCHPFRIGTDGPELLVTASFGFTPALPADEPSLLLDRAEAAVTRSRRCGRNRLHAFDHLDSRFSLIPTSQESGQQLTALTS